MDINYRTHTGELVATLPVSVSEMCKVLVEERVSEGLRWVAQEISDGNIDLTDECQVVINIGHPDTGDVGTQEAGEDVSVRTPMGLVAFACNGETARTRYTYLA